MNRVGKIPSINCAAGISMDNQNRTCCCALARQFPTDDLSGRVSPRDEAIFCRELCFLFGREFGGIINHPPLETHHRQ